MALLALAAALCVASRASSVSPSSSSSSTRASPSSGRRLLASRLYRGRRRRGPNPGDGGVEGEYRLKPKAYVYKDPNPKSTKADMRYGLATELVYSRSNFGSPSAMGIRPGVNYMHNKADDKLPTSDPDSPDSFSAGPRTGSKKTYESPNKVIKGDSFAPHNGGDPDQKGTDLGAGDERGGTIYGPDNDAAPLASMGWSRQQHVDMAGAGTGKKEVGDPYGSLIEVAAAATRALRGRVRAAAGRAWDAVHATLRRSLAWRAGSGSGSGSGMGSGMGAREREREGGGTAAKNAGNEEDRTIASASLAKNAGNEEDRTLATASLGARFRGTANNGMLVGGRRGAHDGAHGGTHGGTHGGQRRYEGMGGGVGMAAGMGGAGYEHGGGGVSMSHPRAGGLGGSFGVYPVPGAHPMSAHSPYSPYSMGGYDPQGFPLPHPGVPSSTPPPPPESAPKGKGGR